MRSGLVSSWRSHFILACAAVSFGVGLSTPIAPQDSLALLTREMAGQERWRTYFIAQPTGSLHSAKLSRGLIPGEKGVGIEAPETTGSIGLVAVPASQPKSFDPTRNPVVNRAEKEGFLMTRAHSTLMPQRRVALSQFASADHHIRAFHAPSRENPRVALLRKTTPREETLFAEAAGDVDVTGSISARVTQVKYLTQFPQGPRLKRFSATDRHCLATAIYHEARGEPVRGQIAVAQVVLNRVKSEYYPNTVCGVVFQNDHWRNRCQFSFACDGKSDRWRDRQSWALAEAIANKVADGSAYLTDVGQATHYHADYVNPRWNRSMNKVSKIGQHIFFTVPGWTVRG